MLHNYLAVAWRTLRRQPVFAAINVGGLAVGIACCLLIGLFVRSELSVNDAFPEAERIYRIDSDWREADAGLPFLTLAPVGPTMQRVYPQVAAQARLYGISADVQVEQASGELALREEAYVTDASMLGVFGLPLRQGDARTALDGPRSVVVREDLARELFGSAAAAMGQGLRVQTWQRGEAVYTITGVWEALPRNSVTQLGGEAVRVLLPHSGAFVPEETWNAWTNPSLMQFVRLAPGADVEALARQVARFVEEYAPEEARTRLDGVTLNPLTALYLTSERRSRIYLVGAIGLFVLLLAGINFANLRTARSLRRAREVGVRRAVGAQRGQLIRQLLGESVGMSLAAAVLGALLARGLLAPFLRLIGTELALTGAPFDALTLGALAGFAVLVGLAAGTYPALVLSGYEPAHVLSGSGAGTAGRGRRAGTVQRGLVAVQFGIAAALLVGVFAVSQQLRYVQSRDLGFAQENVMVIDTVPRDFSAAGRERIETLKAQLRQLPGVASSSLAMYTPGERAQAGRSGQSLGLRRPEWREGRTVTLQYSGVDDDFLETYDIQLTRGRMFDRDRASDSTAVVVNERAAEILGLDAGPLDTPFEMTGSWADAPPLHAVGVIEDVAWGSLHVQERPLVLFPVDGFWREFSVRLTGARPLAETVEAVQATWTRVLGDAPFSFTFMDERVQQAYAAEARTRRVAGVGALLAVVIACLGLFGLSAFAVEERTKEIGIRKALGASAGRIVALLSKDFLRLVLLGLAGATPLAWWALHRWLDGFAYRITLGPLLFVAAGAVVLTVAALTVGTQALRAARTNPAQALRDE